MGEHFTECDNNKLFAYVSFPSVCTVIWHDCVKAKREYLYMCVNANTCNVLKFLEVILIALRHAQICMSSV